MNLLFFDTETTGKANFKAGPEWPDQPRLVQLAAVLFTPAGEELGSFNHIIEPDGWIIPAEASAVHGISNDYAKSFGIPVGKALVSFTELLIQADWLVAHNIDFDDLILASELHRLRADIIEQFKAKRRFCTMKASTDICKLPAPWSSRKYKWPKLTEAHEMLFKEGFEGAHDALADVRACARVYFELQRRAMA